MPLTREQRVPFLGIDASGRPAYHATGLGDVVELFAARRADQEGREQDDRRRKVKVLRSSQALTDDVDDPNDLGQAGWGVVWADGVSQAVGDALAALIDHRRGQIEATRRPEDRDKTLFRELSVRRTDKIQDLRERWGFSPGAVDPGRVRGYLLIVGAPDALSSISSTTSTSTSSLVGLIWRAPTPTRAMQRRRSPSRRLRRARAAPCFSGRATRTTRPPACRART
jgi:hypothetical protein